MKKLFTLYLAFILCVPIYAAYEKITEFSKLHNLSGSNYGIDEDFEIYKIYSVEEYDRYSAFSYGVTEEDVSYKYIFDKENLDTYSKLIESGNIGLLLSIKEREIERLLNDDYKLKLEYKGLSIYENEEKVYLIFEPSDIKSREKMTYIKMVSLEKVETIDDILRVEQQYF